MSFFENSFKSFFQITNMGNWGMNSGIHSNGLVIQKKEAVNLKRIP
jgi:hypothetical protein